VLSLKSFHVFFIVVSILLSVGVGAWGVEQYLERDSAMGLWMAVLFFVAGFALVVYAVRYFGKLWRMG
jgi:hypothetical protein